MLLMSFVLTLLSAYVLELMLPWVCCHVRRRRFCPPEIRSLWLCIGLRAAWSEHDFCNVHCCRSVQSHLQSSRCSRVSSGYGRNNGIAFSRRWPVVRAKSLRRSTCLGYVKYSGTHDVVAVVQKGHVNAHHAAASQ
ncbi:uncharacterized protein MYCGRDRAFT_105478 [Zymoseptoria tritici IPO323]|uniref:Secreted protein n=1 Tax=Zymoseptoria tritici (strain CBS 115943 / IPO323) TaxID=336722 RepID=F9XHR3_ZYMTI|nr:uncharacterized protein MYCGRDRAFT_105478 [Zymoseptoria tritici IPO323]EGP85346.1 hypothetical protein MYCGRDRAFT_105478 [Zymoseptoria tritici IPO323]